MKLLPYCCCIIFFACNTRMEYPEGGFNYPKHVNDKDINFYHYPLKDIEPKKDSFYDALQYSFFQNYNEPNLSIKPQKEDVFRLVYGTALGSDEYLIILKPNSITVKLGDKIDQYEEDTSRLNTDERLHLFLFQRYFPINEAIIKKPLRKRYLDSMVRTCPNLLKAEYFRLLTEKAQKPLEHPFSYFTKHIPLTKEEYKEIVTAINQSGYWKLPYTISEANCTDGFGYTLEANTAKKYQIVSNGNCGDSTRFSKACQKLVEYAGLGNKISLYNDPQYSAQHDSIIVQEVELEDVKPREKGHKN